MEQTKERKFCLAAILVALPAILSVINILDGNLSDIPFSFWPLLVLITLCVLLFLKKQSVLIPLLSGVYAVYSWVFATLYVFPKEFWEYECFFEYLVESVLWVFITLIFASQIPQISHYKNKLPLYGKIFYSLAIAYTLIIVLQIWIPEIKPNFYYFLNHILEIPNSIVKILSSLLAISFTIGLILIVKPMLPQAEKKVNSNGNLDFSDSANQNASASEYFVSMGKHICLLFFTAGIWFMIWIYKATKFGNFAKGEEKKNPTTSLLLFLFVPFYSIYWTYKTAQRIDAIAQEKGLQSDLGMICLILSIFVPIVPPILMQEKINSAITTHKAPAKAADSGIDNLEKYKDLLDKGVITQEEFDAKKKQILGL